LNWVASEGISFADVVERHYNKHCHVPDADNGGEGSCLLVVRDSDNGETRYFTLWYEWNVDHSSDEYITNYHTITEVPKEDVGTALLAKLVEDRDWITLDKYKSYGRLVWPPARESAKEIVHA
jgi:hypothetical protein